MTSIVQRFLLFAIFAYASAQSPQPFRFEKSIPLTGVEGRIDHMSADPLHGRLFIAALGNKSLEVLDWNSGRVVKTIGGLDEPQGIVYRAETNRLYVATAGDGAVRIFDATSFQVLQTLKLGEDADNLRFEAGPNLIWAGYGDGALAAIAAEGRRVADIPLSGHPESFQIEKNGPRIFVNVPHAKHIAVVDRVKKAVVATWSTGPDLSNFPMALDEPSHRLFVVCREPATLLVVDTVTGKIVAKFPTIGDSDDVFYDAVRHRIYATGGEGAIAVYSQRDSDHYDPLTRLQTAPGARTSLFVPTANRLFVAVPHRGAQSAEIRVYIASENSK